MPYGTSTVRRHPLRSAAGIAGLTLGGLGAACLTLAIALHLLTGGMHKESFATASTVFAILGTVTSAWNLPRLPSVLGLLMSIATFAGLWAATTLL